MISEGEFVAAAFKGQASATLEGLADIFGVPDGPSLKRVGAVLEKLDEFGLECVPPPTKGELHTERAIRPKHYEGLGSDFLERCRLLGEGRSYEFKSSMLFDHQKYKHNPGLKWIDFKSSKVTFSLLKATTALMNMVGGYVIVGISDDFTPLGLDWDLRALSKGKQNLDDWELIFREHITGKCKDGNVVNDYIQVNFISYHGVDVAVIQIAARSSLTFLYDGNKYKLFRRQGNRSVEVRIEEIEEFFQVRHNL